MSEPCWASWGEPGNGELDCILDMGHEGPHRVEWEWEAERPAPRETAGFSPWGALGDAVTRTIRGS